jgi:hypothetical protein
MLLRNETALRSDGRGVTAAHVGDPLRPFTVSRRPSVAVLDETRSRTQRVGSQKAANRNEWGGGAHRDVAQDVGRAETDDERSSVQRFCSRRATGRRAIVQRGHGPRRHEKDPNMTPARRYSHGIRHPTALGGAISRGRTSGSPRVRGRR